MNTDMATTIPITVMIVVATTPAVMTRRAILMTITQIATVIPITPTRMVTVIRPQRVVTATITRTLTKYDESCLAA